MFASTFEFGRMRLSYSVSDGSWYVTSIYMYGNQFVAFWYIQ